MAEERRKPGRPKAKGARATLSFAMDRDIYEDMMALVEEKGYIMRSFVERAIKAQIEREVRHE